MKRFLSMFLALTVIVTMPIAVLATKGDVAGYIYSTDICASINGVEVDSYNIGGRTAVIIEDILIGNADDYIYDDSSRTLKFFSLSPDKLVEGKLQKETVPGKIVGKIYETDIKTSIYDVVIPTYNIGGKTAVAIEDLGYDNAFSPIGGKFIWNEKERTISLEFLYSIWSTVSGDKEITVTFNDSMTEATATFEETFHCGGGREHLVFPDSLTDHAVRDVVLPIKACDEIIGYYFYKSLAPDDFTAFTYYYPEKVKEAEKNYTPDPAKTREEIIGHFVGAHSIGEPRERFDTEDYSFVYISVAGTSWTSYNLVQAYDDGTYIDYGDMISARNRSPINLVIDKENETVQFKHVDRYMSEWYTNYEIDLKAGKIRACDNLDTDIGIGTADGQPSASEQTESRNGQYTYKLISGEEEKLVNGFFCHQYYYADMLPLKETLDFLNIRYSFENNILTVDTSGAKSLVYERTENRPDVIGESQIDYLHVDKVLVDGKETKITYPYTSGHFDTENVGYAEAKPYVCNGKVYINTSFLYDILSLCS